jgi:hypothetical protein
MPSQDKHSNFLKTFLNYGRKKFYNIAARRYLLLLDSIRQCEGVAKLLQSKPGEVLDIRPAKNKVAPMAGWDYSVSLKYLVNLVSVLNTNTKG